MVGSAYGKCSLGSKDVLNKFENTCQPASCSCCHCLQVCEPISPALEPFQQTTVWPGLRLTPFVSTPLPIVSTQLDANKLAIACFCTSVCVAVSRWHPICSFRDSTLGNIVNCQGHINMKQRLRDHILGVIDVLLYQAGLSHTSFYKVRQGSPQKLAQSGVLTGPASIWLYTVVKQYQTGGFLEQPEPNAGEPYHVSPAMG